MDIIIKQKKLSIYNYHEYEQWMLNQAQTGWKLSKFCTRNKVEFKKDSPKDFKFLILTTNFSRASFMFDLQHTIRSAYRYSEFKIPKPLGDTSVLYRLQIEDKDYIKLVKQRDYEMLHVLRTKIGFNSFLMSLSILCILAYNFSIVACLSLLFLISSLIYYFACYIKFKKLSKDY